MKQHLDDQLSSLSVIDVGLGKISIIDHFKHYLFSPISGLVHIEIKITCKNCKYLHLFSKFLGHMTAAIKKVQKSPSLISQHKSFQVSLSFCACYHGEMTHIITLN